ncbi:hemagglutinin protein [uncultured Kordia sp.]|uniref:hemagglutinin protein n=1 Tax=uncultured Kordia sp. TaxID=507699 RepID=UPI002614D58B|nr:hemagglutinin protein [uncultured Kordia sp.]
MKYLKFIVLLCSSIGFSQILERSSLDSGGASSTVSNLQLIYSIGETNIQERSGSFQVSEGFITPNFKIKISPIVFLQGPLVNPSSAGLMNDALRSNNYIPTTSPYADNATVDASVFTVTGSNAIVDWVWIELRQENDTLKIVTSRSALLQRDGDVVALDGSSTLVLNVAPGNHHVVMKHRNHLSVMSANPITLSEATTTIVNFTDSMFSTFGSNAQVQLANNVMALWTGNVNGDDIIQYSGTNPDVPSILSEVLNDSGNFLNFPTYVVNGYNIHDINMDGKTQYTGTEPDSPLILQNILAHPGNFLNFSTYQIQEQLPEN